MLNIVNQFIRAVNIPYAVLFIFIGILLVYSKRKTFYLFLALIIFMFSWRRLFTISSSRYCATFLIVLFFFATYSIRNYHFAIPRNITICFVCLILLVFNSIKLFSGFRDVYLLDLADDVRNILFSNSTNDVFIQMKEINRIGISDTEAKRQFVFETPPTSYETLSAFYDTYDYLRKDSYFFFPGKKNNQPSIRNNFSNRNDIRFDEIRHYRTNNKNGYYSVYHHPRMVPPLLSNANEITDSKIKEIVDTGWLQAYDPISEAYVFQVGKKLYWLIGTDIEYGTEIIFHIHTNSPELLPENRRQYGFDNRGFHIRSKDDVKRYGAYILLERDIPEGYPISKIRVGFNTNKKITWSRFFPVSN